MLLLASANRWIVGGCADASLCENSFWDH
jgi:hypothetical protein